MLMARPPDVRDRRHSLTIAGTAQLTGERIAEFEERFDVVLLAAYGMTEGGGAVETRAHRRPGSGGRPTANVEVQIAAQDGQPAVADQPGRIELRDRSAGLAVGYWSGAEALGSIRGGGWFKTNDLGRIDKDGFVHFVGRTRDLVRRAGENISVVEIEDVIRTHPDVAEVGVIGMPDPVMDEELKAVVELRPSAASTLDQLADHCSRHLAPFKVPRYWARVAVLPRTATLRVQKHLLLEVAPVDELDRRGGHSVA
jgi:carnitine-CoA ligase